MNAGFYDLKNQLSSNMVSRDLQTPYLGRDDDDFLTSQLLNDDPESPDKIENKKKISDKKMVGPVIPIMEDDDED